MSSDCVSSDTEGSPAPCSSPADPSWWSDSDGRRSARDVQDVDESPWWDSECEPVQQQVRSDSPNFSPSPCDEDSSASSVTPTWWSEPSSRQLSTTANEIEVDSGRERSTLKSSDGTGSEAERGCDGDEIKLSMALKNRKRPREQSNVSNICQKEPPLSKPKLEPPSPHADPNAILQDLKKGICRPLQSFFLFFTVDLLTKICDLTNVDAWKRILEEPSFASEDGSWEEVTVKEMYAFLAVVLIMRGQQDVCFGAFWREQPDQGSHWPRDLMKRSRFFTLLQVLRLTDHTEEDTAVEKPNQQTGTENHTEQTQSAFVKDGSPLKELKYAFDQLERIFKVFFAQFEFECYAEISLRDGQGYQGDIRNYMKILSPSCEVSLDGTLNLSSRKSGEEVDGLNLGKSTSGETPCNGTLTALESEQSYRIVGTKRTEPKSANRQNASKLRAENCEEGEKELDHALSGSKKVPSVESDDNGDPKTAHISNVVNVRWHDTSLNVTTARATPAKLLSIKDVSEDGMIKPQSWQEVFIPCEELVYKDLFTKTPDTTNSDSAECSSGHVLGKSFFYHYLHLAVYFSTSEDIGSLYSASEGMLTESDSLEQIIEGLVLLGKPDSVVQSGSDTDMTEADTSHDSTSTDQSDSADEDDSKDRKSHKYVQARSQMSRKCALCWSLHQELRRVHTRCTRCGWHLCLSRFRNCMEEAHQDEEIMKQLWDKETGDAQIIIDVMQAEKQ
ncbi:uncharacterized protein LOC119726080 [Patiria miniata]|uniref:PiggyBac transposable element-derived protein domain-containing protein n=1 Tax=Patiria miniata TaxID=46514 RepID=A0A913ZPH2_PATMI|nr:uncharacterized protein LOC119726080 [Patiria miniata]